VLGATVHRDVRISHTLLKSIDGFRAELDGLDLPTIVQMICGRRVRLVLRVRSRDREGLLYFDDGCLVHAVAPGCVGEAAIHAMLGWESGEMAPVERPWPQARSIEGSAEHLLLRAAHLQDEGRREDTQTKRTEPGRRLEVVPTEAPRTMPNEPPSSLPRPHPAARPPGREHAVRASVRLSSNGELISAEGDEEMFGELVAYLIRLGAVLGAELALEPFESLHAELGGERLVVFADGADTVGLLLRPGATASELRRQLGH
jgi:hypothetical protein